MGPYVLRSINAHFKLWDTSVQDSFTENITQASVNSIPYIPTTCTCHYVDSGCGSVLAGSKCGPTQKIYTLDCGASPQGCGESLTGNTTNLPATECVEDTTGACCNAWTNIGCGTIPVGQRATANNCNYGYQIQGHQCGASTAIQCVQDATCNPQCLGILSQEATACTNEPPATAPLDQNYGITYVANKAACDPNRKCQFYCQSKNNNTYILNPTGTGCVLFNQCQVVDFQVPHHFRDPGQSGQQCSGLVQDDENQFCAAIGFTTSITAPYNHGFGGSGGDDTNWRMITPVTSTGGSFTESINGHTLAFQATKCGGYGWFYCSQATPTNPNPTMIENATICPDQPLPKTSYSIPSNTCDGKTPCQVVCNAGYYAVSTAGPCIPIPSTDRLRD